MTDNKICKKEEKYKLHLPKDIGERLKGKEYDIYEGITFCEAIKCPQKTIKKEVYYSEGEFGKVYYCEKNN